jgi:uncharacterized protein
MEANAVHSVPAPALRKRLTALLLALLLYYASQALSLLDLARLFFSAQTSSIYVWIGVYEHHLWQLAAALCFIGIFSRGRFTEWGLNLRNAALSWRIFLRFCLVYLPIVVIDVVVSALRSHDNDLGIFAPATAGNITGWLSFEWLFVGISEEILFRGFIQTYLARNWPGEVRIRGLSLSHAGLLTTILFCLAHINPLHPQISWEQQIFAFGLGLYYSEVYRRTGSLLNPIVAHNFADGTAVTLQYLVYFHLR